MSDTKDLTINKKSDIAFQSDVEALGDLLTQTVQNYSESAPKYAAITEKLLNIFEKDEEIAAMEHKDLLKLLDSSQKAQLQPVIEITKMIKALTELEDINKYKQKTEKLEGIIKAYEVEKAQHESYKTLDATITTSTSGEGDKDGVIWESHNKGDSK